MDWEVRGTGVHRQCERRMNSESMEGSPGASRGGRISRLPQAGTNHLDGLEITAPTLLQGGESRCSHARLESLEAHGHLVECSEGTGAGWG